MVSKLSLSGILTIATFVAACGGSSGGPNFGGDNFTNACGATGTASATVAAVPLGGAAIAVERAFPDLSFTQPLWLGQEPADDRCWYVIEKAGHVLSFENSDTASTSESFIDIEARVDSTEFEAGLLGMAFHPDYANNGEVFLSYTGDAAGQLTSYVSRFRSTNNGRTLDPDSEEIILSLTQPFDNHNGGNIAFGPDGYLYIGFGDGGSGNDPGERAQNTMNLFGTMLRIDVDNGTPYSIPADNPFSGNDLCSQGFGAADCPEIYAWGLRNPWRWSFDSANGDLWVGDVGQQALEEIDVVDLGGNYGWPFLEGTRCNTEAPVVNCSFPGIPPITEYDRSVGAAVTGGYVYRGSDIPDLVGAYVYSDSVSGVLLQYFDDNGTIIEAETSTGLNVVSFGESNTGELYVVDLGFSGDGGIYKIVAD